MMRQILSVLENGMKNYNKKSSVGIKVKKNAIDGWNF